MESSLPGSGFGQRGTEGKVAIRYARENDNTVLALG